MSRRLLSRPHVPTLMLATTVAQLPIGMVPLALIWFGHDIGKGLAVGGLLSGSYAAGNAVIGPFVGRLADRRGMRGALLGAALVHTVALGALIALGLAGASTLALVGVAAIAGGAFPPVTGARRRLWSSMLADDLDLEDAAYALDAVAFEATFVAGPALLAVLLALASPVAGLATGGALTLLGTAWFLARVPVHGGEPRGAAPARLAGALAARGMPAIVGSGLVVAVAFGTPPVALSAYALELGSPGLTGVLLGLQGVGSVAGGLLYGARPTRRGTLVQRYLAFSAAVPLAFAALALAPSLPVLLLMMAPSGLALTPMVAERLRLVARISPEASLTEAFTWTLTATTLGQALGAMLTGALLEVMSWQGALLVGCAVGLAGVGLGWMLRESFSHLRSTSSSQVAP
jgi:MFS family permease